MTRITLTSRSRGLLADNQFNLTRVAKLQDQLASGKRVEVMSDDPIAGRRAMILRVEKFQGQSYLANIERSMSFLSASDSAFGQMSEVLDQAKDLAVQGADGTQSAASRKALATSVESLLTRMVDLGNTVHDGRFIFAGTDVFTRPFALADDEAQVEYHGNLDTFEVAISPSERAQVNQDGHSLFKSDNDVFAALIDLRDALKDNDPDTISALIADIDTVHAHINDLNGNLGGRMQRLQMTQSQIEKTDLQLGELISREVDVDMAETITNLQTAQVALEAGLQSGARMIQPSLLDYL